MFASHAQDGQLVFILSWSPSTHLVQNFQAFPVVTMLCGQVPLKYVLMYKYPLENSKTHSGASRLF